MSDNLTKYEVLIEQYLRSILDISGFSLKESFISLLAYVGFHLFTRVEETMRSKFKQSNAKRDSPLRFFDLIVLTVTTNCSSTYSASSKTSKMASTSLHHRKRFVCTVHLNKHESQARNGVNKNKIKKKNSNLEIWATSLRILAIHCFRVCFFFGIRWNFIATVTTGGPSSQCEEL